MQNNAIINLNVPFQICYAIIIHDGKCTFDTKKINSTKTTHMFELCKLNLLCQNG